MYLLRSPHESVERHFSMRETHKAKRYDEVSVNHYGDKGLRCYFMWTPQGQSNRRSINLYMAFFYQFQHAKS